MVEGLSYDLKGMTMVVTCAGRGIGREISQMAALSGARVALLDIDQSTLGQSIADIRALGGDVTGYQVDLGVAKSDRLRIVCEKRWPCRSGRARKDRYKHRDGANPALESTAYWNVKCR